MIDPEGPESKEDRSKDQSFMTLREVQAVDQAADGDFKKEISSVKVKKISAEEFNKKLL